MWKQNGAFLVLQSALNQGGLTSMQHIFHSSSFGLFFFFIFPREFWPLQLMLQTITPSVLKARLTFVAEATSQPNPHVYLEKCPSFSSPRTQTLQCWFMATFTYCSKGLIWAIFTWKGNRNSNGNPWSTFPYGSQDTQKLSIGRWNYFKSGDTWPLGATLKR